MAAGRDQPPPAPQENPAVVAPLLTGHLRVDMPAELGWIFNEQRLPYKSKGGQDGLMTVCAQLGIPLAAGQRTAAVLREKLYAYHAAVRDGSTQPAALAAAAEVTDLVRNQAGLQSVNVETPLSEVGFQSSFESVCSNKALLGIVAEQMAFELQNDNLEQAWVRPFSKDHDHHHVELIGLMGGTSDCVVLCPRAR
jgi:hypothetical protein